MKKIIIAIISFTIIGISCTKDITRFNENTKFASEVPGEALFTYSVTQLTNTLASSDVNLNIFRFIDGYWAATTYQDEPQYDFQTRAIPDRFWTRLYINVLMNMKDAKRIITDDPEISDDVRKNKLAQCDLIQVMGFYILITTYGNVPYSEALDNNNFFPKYEDGKTIMDDLIKRAQADVAAMNPDFEGISASQDVIYQGDVTLWKKFGNSVLMRLAMTIADSDPAQAKSVFETASPGALSITDPNAKVTYQNTTPNTNPLYTELVLSGRQDMVAGKPLLDQLVEKSDPRLALYFRPNSEGVQVGGVIGENNTFAITSKPSAQMVNPTFPQVLIGVHEVEFLRAEAIERGFNVSGTASEHYSNAITASILQWGGTDDAAATYLKRPDVAYNTAAGDYKQKIGYQKWIALYDECFQSWVEMRRLDAPGEKIVPLPEGAQSGYPNRFPYPQNEQSYNPEGYAAGAAAIGGDEVETKLWWDKSALIP